MPYVVTLSAGELSAETNELRLTQRLTKPFSKRNAVSATPLLALIVSISEDSAASRTLTWIGVAVRHGISGRFDNNITIDPLREIHDYIPLDGPDGLLAFLAEEPRREFENSCINGSVGSFSTFTWDAIESAVRERHPQMVPMLDWLLAQAAPEILSPDNRADMGWLEEQDGVRTIKRITDLPPETANAWRRPSDRNAPYLAGLIPEPVESSMLEHDARASAYGDDLYHDWTNDPQVRFDIHVAYGSAGRRIEIANVNATPVESRLGTDLIYYHEPSASFTLVQYKRLTESSRSISIGDQFEDQLRRLRKVSHLSQNPATPAEWKLGHDSCFLKLAHWSPSSRPPRVDTLIDGMYLPLSYVDVLLNDPCTLSGRERQNGRPGRVLGYKQVPRHLVGSQFIQLVQHGLVGTVGVNRDQLRGIVDDSLENARSAVIGRELSQESPKERQNRLRSRGAKPRSKNPKPKKANNSTGDY
ncbi:hypothetical protein [Nocardia jiangxiensis]|uniref:hypothetical protein n=1 Tax=Nocardia jiangxiensis TaxID=282685 RepID=UPI0002E4B530|nr:hypothetical protein [Nocardia jiangxiensis]